MKNWASNILRDTQLRDNEKENSHSFNSKKGPLGAMYDKDKEEYV